MKYTAEQVAQARGFLKKALKPGMTVHTVLRHRSSSGMTRSISLGLCSKEGFADITWAAAHLLGLPVDQRDGGAKVGGCGMDMGFHLVYSLSNALYPTGVRCIGRNCPSNDHTNGDRNYEPHTHRDGGYALRHKWI